MVSTRKVKYKFSEGEKVLCYEPDPTKKKVLYDSKVVGIIETKDKRGKKFTQYKIHFQGWNSSWDRRVNESYVLKDTDENRQLQKDLAEKAQLQLAAYLYRRDLKKRNRKENSTEEDSTKNRLRRSSEDNSSTSTERPEHEFSNMMRERDCDTESISSSIESFQDEERVQLNVGEKIKQYLESDFDAIKNVKKQHCLPAQMPVVTILENFVKQSAMKMIFCSSSNDYSRRRNSTLRGGDKKESNLEKINNRISLLKEVADGLRILLNFTLEDHLLYSEEKEQANHILAEENLKNFTYIASERQLPDDVLHLKFESITTPLGSEISDANQNSTESLTMTNSATEEPSGKRRLRSHQKNDENETPVASGSCGAKSGTNLATDSKQFEIQNLNSSIASTSSGSSPLTTSLATNLSVFKSIPAVTHAGVSTQTREFLQKILSWQMLPSDAAPEPSMIFGAIHLARLVVKLPEFLNASTITDDKLKLLLQNLDLFIAYLENHKEWFGDHNYKDFSDKSPVPVSV